MPVVLLWKETVMNCKLLALPVATALALSLSACGRDQDRMVDATNPELPRMAHAPVNADRPAAGTMLNPDTSDPSIPKDPANTDPTKKDRSPPYGTGEPAKEKPEG
jgi:hypothetical protein